MTLALLDAILVGLVVAAAAAYLLAKAFRLFTRRSVAGCGAAGTSCCPAAAAAEGLKDAARRAARRFPS